MVDLQDPNIALTGGFRSVNQGHRGREGLLIILAVDENWAGRHRGEQLVMPKSEGCVPFGLDARYDR